MELSILIACHNRSDLTAACLRSLRETLPRTLEHEIIVYDDKSTDDTAELLDEAEAEWPRVFSSGSLRTLRQPGRGTFASNNNLAARDAKGRWLALLNNDVECRAGWLEPLLDLAEREPSAGVISNLHAFPGTGTLAHAGVVIDDDLIPRNLYEGLPETLPAVVGVERRMTAACAACWLVERELFVGAGGFDVEFVNGHEDIDLCLRLGDDGRPTWISGKSTIDHRTSSTAGRFDHADENHRLFLRRWGDSLTPDLARVTQGDGVRWPDHGIAYRAARAVWRFPPARAMLTPVLRSPAALSARQRLLRSLSKTKHGDQ
ncbi:MAG: glycosyltransferase [Planctomycetota bacterium]